MIRSTLKRLARRALGREKPAAPAPAPQTAKPTTSSAAPKSPSSESASDKPWYLDGSEETFGWENTNAKDEEDS